MFIEGTSGNDSLDGTSGDDTLSGLEGNDTLNGLAGNDDLRDGDGDDLVSGGAGDDTIFSGLGADTIDGGDGFDEIRIAPSGASLDLTIGSSTIDEATFVGQDAFSNIELISVIISRYTVFDDTLDGAAATTSLLLFAGGGDDIVIGGSGDDTIEGVVGNDTVTGGAGADVFDFDFTEDISTSGDVITDFENIDVIDFSTINTIGEFGGVQGLDLTFIGNSAFSGAVGEFRYETGGGETQIQVDEDGDGTADRFVLITNGEFTLYETYADSAVLTTTLISPTEGSDSISGTVSDDVIDALGGDDTVEGLGGNDDLRGRDGDDSLIGGDGNDFLSGGEGNDTLRGGAGDDVLIAETGYDIVIDGGAGGRDSFTIGVEQSSGEFVYGADPSAGINFVYGPSSHSAQLIDVELVEFLSSSGGYINLVVGDAGANALSPTQPYGALIFGGDGNDTLTGDSGSDTLFGGAGADVMTGGSGPDHFVFTAYADIAGDTLTDFEIGDFLDLSFSTALKFIGDEAFSGASNEYRVEVGGGQTLIQIDEDGDGAADRTISLTNGELSLRETADGSNILEVAEVAAATSGADFIRGTIHGDTIDGLGGNDTLEGSLGNDSLIGGDGADMLSGGAGEDTLSGGAGDDLLLLVEGGQDTVDGGDDYDTARIVSDGALYYGGTVSDPSAVNVQSGLSYPSVFHALINVERVERFTSGDVLAEVGLFGSTGDDRLDLSGEFETERGFAFGGDGDDTLIGGDSDDTFWSYYGSDSVSGGDGDDSVHEFADANNNIDGGAGRDSLSFSVIIPAGSQFSVSVTDSAITFHREGTVTTISNIEQIFIGDSTTDDASFDGSASSADLYFQASIGQSTLIGGAGDDTLDVSGGDSIANGNAGDDLIYGDSGFDLLQGGSGNDTITGFDNDDTLVGGVGADSLNGDSGTDTADYAGSSAGVLVRLWNGTGENGDAQGDALTNIENVSGSSHNDTLLGANGAANTLSGGAGNDLLYGLSGDDVLTGGSGADALDGGSGVDTADYAGSSAGVLVRLWNGTGENGDAQGDALTNIENVSGSSHNDTLLGANGAANTLSGGAGNDLLYGLSGDDVLTGGSGVDTLNGGSGDDLFQFGVGSGADTITDFAAGAATDDEIELIGFGAAFDSFAEVIAAASDDGTDTTIDFGGGDTITLENVVVADLHEDDFLFGG